MCRAILLAFAIAIFGTSSEALALGGDHPPGKMAKDYNKQWPLGLTDAINLQDRVWGHWVNQNDFFYYRGDATALNKLLAAYGNLTDTPLAIVLHTGSKPTTGSLGGDMKLPYDWQIEVLRRGWGAPVEIKPTKNMSNYVVTIHLWLSDALTLDKLEIPKHIEVRSAGDLERFIETHRKK